MVHPRGFIGSLNLVGLAVLVLLAAACGAARAIPSGAQSGELIPITVEDVRVEVGVGSPIPVNVLVAGSWPHLCAQLAEMKQTLDGQQINISLMSEPEPDSCPPDQIGLPFGISIPLNGVELPEGTYTITVNGKSTTFDWAKGQ